MEKQIWSKDNMINELKLQVDTIRSKTVAECGLDELRQEL